MIKISPSILSCDFSQMGNELIRMEQAGADMIHFDVMDGHFVPNITIGAPVIKSLRALSGIVFDVHLMISDPLKYAQDFVLAGADILTFHLESDSDAFETIKTIRDLGCRPGISIKPKTPAEAVFEYLGLVDMVLVMTVEPGFGGQKFMHDMMPKVKAVYDECKRQGIDIDIQVDGGIDLDTVKIASEAGANVFVSGKTVFAAKDAAKIIEQLRQNAQ